MSTPKKPKAWRKLFDWKNYDIVIQKLEEVWAMWWTDEEASLNAGISKSALSDFLSKNYSISERKNQLLMNPIILARKVIFEEISKKKNATLAFKYLERKRPKEFWLNSIDTEEEARVHDNLKRRYLELTKNEKYDPIWDLIKKWQWSSNNDEDE